MKLRKIFATVLATAVAVTALAATTSAAIYKTPGDYYTPEGEPGPILNTDGNWLIQIYNVGSEAESKPKVDFDIDVTKIAKIDVVIEPAGDFADLFEGAWGGGVIFSSNGGVIGKSGDLFNQYNWPSNEWWGVINNGAPATADAEATGIHDPSLGLFNTQDTTKECLTTALQDGTYVITYNIPVEDRWIEGADCYQTGIQEWGSDLAEVKVDKFIMYDEEGNVMLAFDELGTPIDASEATYAEPIDLDAALAAANGEGDAEETTVAEETTTAAEATTVAEETTAAPAATASNGLSTTTIIIIIVAAVVVIAVIIIIVVVSKKKKN